MPRLPRVSSASISELKALPDLAEQQNGLAKPAARGRDLLGEAPMPKIAVAGAGRGATTIGAAVHPASTPSGHGRRFTRLARPRSRATATVTCVTGTHGVVRHFSPPAPVPPLSPVITPTTPRSPC
jgi:hypothetical protein